MFLVIVISLYEAYTFHSSPRVFKDYYLKEAPELTAGQEFTTVTNIDFSKYPSYCSRSAVFGRVK